MTEWNKRLTQVPETAALPFGIFPQPHVVHEAFMKHNN